MCNAKFGSTGIAPALFGLSKMYFFALYFFLKVVVAGVVDLIRKLFLSDICNTFLLSMRKLLFCNKSLFCKN